MALPYDYERRAGQRVRWAAAYRTTVNDRMAEKSSPRMRRI